jgi:GcrA cell cycle regulator
MEMRDIMESFSWAPAHCEALRVFVSQGLSFAEAALAINKKFGSDYTRSAAIGRARRMGLVVRPKPRPIVPKQAPRAKVPCPLPSREQSDGELQPPAEPLHQARPVKLRCVGITPRLLALLDLEPADCRYPYGGDKDGEAITFCGHPRLPGSSYCGPHFHLTRGDGTPSERAVSPVVLRLVAAA